MEKERWNIVHPKLKVSQLAYYEKGYFLFAKNNNIVKLRLNDAKFHNNDEKKRFYNWLNVKK